MPSTTKQPLPPGVALRVAGLTKRYPGKRRWTPSGEGFEDDDEELADDSPVDEPTRPADVLALDAVDLVVARGSLVGVVGPAGAGKTTFVRLIAGTLRETSGDIHTAGCVAPPPEMLASLLEPGRSGRRNLILIADFLAVPRKLLTSEAAEVFASAGLRGAEERRVEEYPPGGPVALTLATLVHAPVDVYLFDGVPKIPDDEVREHLELLLRRRLAAGAVAIMTSRRASLLSGRAHYMVELEAGRVLSRGPTAAATRCRPETGRAQVAVRERFVGASSAGRVGELKVESTSGQATRLRFEVETFEDAAAVTVGVLIRGEGSPPAKYALELEPRAPGPRRVALALPGRAGTGLKRPHRITVAILVSADSGWHSVSAPNSITALLTAVGNAVGDASAEPEWEVS